MITCIRDFVIPGHTYEGVCIPFANDKVFFNIYIKFDYIILCPYFFLLYFILKELLISLIVIGFLELSSCISNSFHLYI